MKEDNNILGSVEKLFQSQSNIQNSILFMLKATGVLILFILIIGVFASWLRITKPPADTSVFNRDVYQEGSVKYQNEGNAVFLTESFFDEQIAVFINSQTQYNMNALGNYLNNKLMSKLIVFPPSSFLLNKPRTEEAFSQIEQRYQKTKDSLSNVLRRRMYLDYSGTSMLERININENYISAFRNSINNIRFNYGGDFIERGTEYLYQIGKISSVRFVYPDRVNINCSETTPVFSSAFLLKAGVPKANINESNLKAQAAALVEIVNRAEISFKQQKNAERISANKAVASQRKDYRHEFYIRWYSELLLLINSVIFILLLVRYGTIIGQRKLPRKSTDIVYYATNRTSRLFRIIAIIIVGVAILKIAIGFIVSLFTRNDFISSFTFIPIRGGLFLKALLDPPVTYISTIIVTWFFILTSEWIDFLSNCYEVLFYKAHEKKINQHNDSPDKSA